MCLCLCLSISYLFWLEFESACSASARASRLAQSGLALGQQSPRVDTSASSAEAQRAAAGVGAGGVGAGGVGVGVGVVANRGAHAAAAACSLRVRRAELDGAHAALVLELSGEQLLGLLCKPHVAPDECARLAYAAGSQSLVELIAEPSRELLFLHFQLSSVLLAFDYTGTISNSIVTLQTIILVYSYTSISSSAHIVVLGTTRDKQVVTQVIECLMLNS